MITVAYRGAAESRGLLLYARKGWCMMAGEGVREGASVAVLHVELAQAPILSTSHSWRRGSSAKRCSSPMALARWLEGARVDDCTEWPLQTSVRLRYPFSCFTGVLYSADGWLGRRSCLLSDMTYTCRKPHQGGPLGNSSILMRNKFFQNTSISSGLLLPRVPKSTLSCCTIHDKAAPGPAQGQPSSGRPRKGLKKL